MDIYKKKFEDNEDYWYEVYNSYRAVIKLMIECRTGFSLEILDLLHENPELQENFITANATKLVEARLENESK